MFLFAGLGNPGASYAGHRHNFGFMVADAIARQHGFSAERNRFSGLLREGRIGEKKVLVLKPQTFMNESGQSVGAAARYYDLAPRDVIVFHDELDLALGKLRVKEGGGHGGHNGVRSLIAHLGPYFVRVRLGIGHPGDRDRVTPYVLSDFAAAERPLVDEVCDAVAAAAPWLVLRDWPRFMTEVARRVTPPAASAGDAVEPDRG
ncbi:MAG: aminoacyl-tRNA hydrolase [Rhodothalassiaceae bacterium]